MDSETLSLQEPLQESPQESTFTIKTFEYKRGIPAYKASIVDLTLVAMVSLNNIDVSTKFGTEFYKLSGNKINEFLEFICKMYDVCSVSDPHSRDYRTSYNFWFSEIPLKRRVKYAELHLDNAVHKLNLLLNVLIIQLRTKLEFLRKAHVSSDFSESLINEIDKLLDFLPHPQQKEIVITDKRDVVGEDGTLPIKTITITYEPFIEFVNASFNEASKLKRIGNDNKDKQVEKHDNVDKKAEFKKTHEAKPNKKKEVSNNQPDSDGWIMKKNKK